MVLRRNQADTIVSLVFAADGDKEMCDRCMARLDGLPAFDRVVEAMAEDSFKFFHKMALDMIRADPNGKGSFWEGLAGGAELAPGMMMVSAFPVGRLEGARMNWAAIVALPDGEGGVVDLGPLQEEQDVRVARSWKALKPCTRDAIRTLIMAQEADQDGYLELFPAEMHAELFQREEASDA